MPNIKSKKDVISSKIAYENKIQSKSELKTNLKSLRLLWKAVTRPLLRAPTLSVRSVDRL